MDNIFLQNSKHSTFSWDNLGNIREGRGNLGEEMPVLVYRLMQYTILDVLSKEFGATKANDLIRAAGHLAGTEFANNTLDLNVDLGTFVSNLQSSLEKLKVGILRMESFNIDTGELTLTVSQDLDCSGLPITNETVCDYDEGFIAGILMTYTGKPYRVREIDCWANGDRVCRFKGTVENN